ncbi:condensin complex subunit SMC1 [Fistulina hepatica ATCC 64428]|uniref:Structural maintenance of chromosomes protein n=1 Tax=Fistulina hepatica ATCC 64428 TaxID=1128425 RepID=A0A0D7AMF1_9AGAR|nr:condensin complex subunit SMC1 [Fistulina hepatica ATCC 64428]
MPLVQIEVCDFKSYRGHQVIGPFNVFTSVIGPNGAGKSNLMDAISFVLGVKSAQLRSSQLRDLVYRGRKMGEDAPEDDEGEGTAKKAWVMAIYIDGESKEWRFQRTISTTGASEYKLNDKVVAYSAYNQALISHNILVKAKNFLVFQGDVEAVASQSPQALSRLIDQISGSLELSGEYEKAKEAQEKATENATFNFTKRRGIAGEIKQYKEQKGEAERFEALCAERDELIRHRMLFKLYHIEEAIESNAREIKDFSKDLAGLREEQQENEEALDAARADQAKAKSVFMQVEKQIKKAEKKRESKLPDIVATDAQIAHSTRKIDNSDKTRGEVLKGQETLRAKVEHLRMELERTRRAAQMAEEEQRKASAHNVALSEETTEEYRHLKSQASLLAVDERQQIETLTREEKTANRAFFQLQEKERELQDQKETRGTDLEAQNARQSELEDKLNGLMRDLHRTKQELDSQQAERTRIRQLEDQIAEKLSNVHDQLLQAGVDKHESEKEVKLKETIASLQRVFPGVRGRVVDLCKPTQRKYETAVSVVLGRNIDAIVVDEEKTAIECIEYMRSQRVGQATFIPLDTIQVKPINDKFRSFVKGSRLAVDVIQYDPVVERAMHHACGSALVCDTMEVARHICYDKGQEVKAVTLEGTIIHKSGLITGGRSTHGNSKKWDEKDVQGLIRTRDKLMADLRQLAKEKPRDKTDENLIAEIARLESSAAVIRDDLNACRSRVNGLKDELRHIERQLTETAPLLRDAEAAHGRLKQQIEQLQGTIDIAEDGVFADFCRKIHVSNIREYEERQLKAAEETSQVLLRYEKQIARLTHQFEFENEALEGTQDRLARLQATIDKEEVTLQQLQTKKEEGQRELDDTEAGINTLKERLDHLQEDLDQKTKATEEARKVHAKVARVLDQALKDISLKNNQIEKLALGRSSIYRKCRLEEVKLPLLVGNLKNVPMEEHLREEVAMDVDGEDNGAPALRQVQDYGIEVDFSRIEDDEREDNSAETLAELDSNIAKLSADIEKMAPNMKAMDRLGDVETKLAETEREADQARRDSRNARERFNDVKRRRCEMFNKAYNHISERIDQVYKDLTKGKASPMGGVAYLSLEDNEEPYAAGIKYHAMPPMKRFRDMEQLSGGEKTVAALALLFAIHSYQPAPFFVLDEVDAALDNTNVAKVANYIRIHASESFQFIVISLKGSLYERGNSLVGIYRDQDVNSSRSLTLDLTQYDD